MRRRSATSVRVGAVLALALLSAACGRNRTAQVPQSPIPGGATLPGGAEVGYASWYGDPYHGRRAASGEVYDKNQMTAAHRTLPFDTMVRVIHLENERSVAVRINDRGPFVKGRIIDLSLAAAKELAMIGPGTALVRLELLENAAVARSAGYAVQVGAYRERATAENVRSRLATRHGGALIEEVQAEAGLLYRVRVGPRATLPEAQQLARQLENESWPGFVVRLENDRLEP